MSRTTIGLDDALQNRLRRYAPARGLNRFITQAIAEKIDAIERREIEDNMREGYMSRAQETDPVIEDWSALDTVDWAE